MLGIKILIYSFIFLTSSFIGILISKKYVNRVNELLEFKNGLNIFKAKIKYTYEPIPDIFKEISEKLNYNVSNVFKTASQKMCKLSASTAWDIALNLENLNISEEDKNALSNLGKLLGQTDISGQLSQIELTTNFLNEQIKKAENDRIKSEKLYKTLGMIIGITIVILLV